MKALRFGAILLVVLLVQTSLVAKLSIFGVRGDVVLLLPIVAGILGGSDRGAMVGFASGLAFDLLLQTPFGLSALTYCLVGYGVGLLQGGVLRSTWWIPVLSALGASAAGVVGFAVVGKVLGQDSFIDGRLPKIAVIVGIINAALVLPALRVARSALPISVRSPRLVPR
ncbi:MAG: rod shape-determining protein MreD [Acidimicrobiaceae bacterium]|jgi:rod shape-determining protein MreD